MYNILAKVVADAFYIWIKDHVDLESNDSLSLAQRRPHHLNHWLPARYRDIVPEPPRPLAPTEAQGNLGEVGLSHLSCPPSALTPPAPHLPLFPSCPKIKTQPNSFGLFQLYDEDSLPINDPDMENSLDELGPFFTHENSSKFNEGITDASNPFYPYPNKTSLLLGDWSWNSSNVIAVSWKTFTEMQVKKGYSWSEQIRICIAAFDVFFFGQMMILCSNWLVYSYTNTKSTTPKGQLVWGKMLLHAIIFQWGVWGSVTLLVNLFQVGDLVSMMCGHPGECAGWCMQAGMHPEVSK